MEAKEKTVLKNEIIQKIKKDKVLKLQLALLLNKAHFTIERYLKTEDSALTENINALLLIAKHYNTTISEIT